MNKRLFKHSRTLHKWAGYVLVLQLFAWLMGGLVMSALPLDKVHGKHLAKRTLENPFSSSDYTASLDNIRMQMPSLRQLQFTHRLNQPIIIAAEGKQEHAFHAQTGQLAAALNQEQAERIAYNHYLGEGKVSLAEHLITGPQEVGYRQDVWRIEFDDWCATTLYLDAHSGQFITVRSTIWRIFDFFWMLHIMDYQERKDFNNPLLISFAAASVLFAITGGVLLLQNPPWRRRKKRS
ncbi:hypothetical protein EXT46_14035 [Pseudoalteromonas sp. CO325X]|uniref:hypothetical protein n=1 Tax=Pseudoalteromonas sp. CO325X TaxID=1777262 RepID=UPI001023140F|nr:hypothetical protein [Pseudoalteromonas sp. CO325X]RZF79607.1 hypothetical protein EXT46_14035 [Pseudoalteromonas sp. CO325X]